MSSLQKLLLHPFWTLRENAHASLWPPVARELGLHWDAPSARMSGYIGEHFVAARTTPSDAEVCAALWPPLDLVLRRRSGLPVGFDRNHTYLNLLERASAEPKRVRELVQPIRPVLLGQPYTLQLRNDYVTLWKRSITTGSDLRRMVHTALAIVSAIDDVRPQVSYVAHARALLREWETAATSRGMVLNVTPLGYHGAQRKIDLQFFLQRRGTDAWSLKSSASFRQALGIGFSARSFSTPLDDPWGLEPLEIGDPRFDRLFSVSAFEPRYVRQALSEGARSRLATIAEKGMHVVVHDHGIVVESRLLGSASLDTLLDDLVSTAELVDFTLPTPAAYR